MFDVFPYSVLILAKYDYEFNSLTIVYFSLPFIFISTLFFLRSDDLCQL